MLFISSPIHDYSNTSDHTTSLENFSIVGRKEQNLSRLINESMFIRVNSPSLNKNIGKYHLPHLWDEVLINSRELKLKYIDSVAVQSATKAIRSAYITTMWIFHLPQGNNISPSHKVAIPSATNGNNISHHIFGKNISHHMFGNNISQQQVVITSTTI